MTTAVIGLDSFFLRGIRAFALIFCIFGNSLSHFTFFFNLIIPYNMLRPRHTRRPFEIMVSHIYCYYYYKIFQLLTQELIS